jgi:hypothetical protein
VVRQFSLGEGCLKLNPFVILSKMSGAQWFFFVFIGVLLFFEQFDGVAKGGDCLKTRIFCVFGVNGWRKSVLFLFFGDFC